MPRYSITHGPRFRYSAGLIDAISPDQAARLAAARFFDGDRVERLTGRLGEGGTFQTTRDVGNPAAQHGQRFLVVGPAVEIHEGPGR
jgi:hypothetical protein